MTIENKNKTWSAVVFLAAALVLLLVGVWLAENYRSKEGENNLVNGAILKPVDQQKLAGDYQAQFSQIVGDYLAAARNFQGRDSASFISQTEGAKSALLALTVPATAKTNHVRVVLMLDAIVSQVRIKNYNLQSPLANLSTLLEETKL